jgi:serine/threonine protein kinase
MIAKKLITKIDDTHIIGTIGYSAPEKYEDYYYAQKTSDYFSMGVCLFAILFGKFPFEKYGDDD